MLTLRTKSSKQFVRRLRAPAETALDAALSAALPTPGPSLVRLALCSLLSFPISMFRGFEGLREVPIIFYIFLFTITVITIHSNTCPF